MKIYPFAAIRSPAHRVSEVSCPPYDVVDRSQAAELATAKPNSFMRVVRAEVDCDPASDAHSPQVHARARRNFLDLIARGYLVRDPEPGMYVYRQSTGGRRQAGLVCCVGVDEYRSGSIRKHELTRPDKEGDRVSHMRAVGAHTESVLLAAPEQPELVRLLARDMNDRPLVHFAAKDGVTHTLWRVHEIAPYIELFGSVEMLFIADGHHRCAAAARLADDGGATDSTARSADARCFPATIFPAEELHILPYHRLVRFAAGQSSAQVARHLRALGTLDQTAHECVDAPTRAGEVGVFMDGAWWQFHLPASSCAGPLEGLDVVRLSNCVLGPILGITDERIDQRISFAGGCSRDQLAQIVLRGEADIAFAMHPTSMDQLLQVARANLIMPPKSTWFDPKLRSGLFAHAFESALTDELASTP